MNAPSPNDLIKLAAKLEDFQLETQFKDRPFTVRTRKGGIEFTPSTGSPRTVSAELLQRVCDQYNETESPHPGEYKKTTVDASYILTLIAIYLAGDAKNQV